jgi:Uma2 family endonuclease
METYIINTKSVNLTDEQFFQLCVQNKEIRFERDKYKNIILMAPTGTISGYYHSDFITELNIWNRKTKLGYCFDSSAGFTLPDGSVRNPDAAWIEKSRWEKIPLKDKKRFAHICPDFVIEVLSETDSLKQQQEKMEEWIKNGCRLGWLIDIENRKVYIYKPNRKPQVRYFSSILSGEDVLPGFELDLSELVK